jgi:hypothetical protein
MNIKKKKRDLSRKVEKDLKSQPDNGFFVFNFPGCEIHFVSENGKLLGTELGVSILKEYTPAAFHKYLQVDPN